MGSISITDFPDINSSRPIKIQLDEDMQHSKTKGSYIIMQHFVTQVCTANPLIRVSKCCS